VENDSPLNSCGELAHRFPHPLGSSCPAHAYSRHMEPFEIEGAALEFYRRAGVDPERPIGVLRLLMACPDIDVEFCPRLHRPAKLIVAPDGRMRIQLRSTDSAIALSWRAGHETGEALLVRSRCVSPHIEQYADNLAGAIVAPMPALRALRARAGSDFARIAGALRTSQTIAALRYGEVFDEPLAVILPGRVKRRGPVDGLPSDAELRRIVRAGGCREALVVPLADARARSVVIAN